MIKICVTGNNGFIGRALQKELLKKGIIVLGIDKWIFEREPWAKNLTEYLEKLNPDAVFHVGACSNTQNNDLNEVLKLNVESTHLITDYCKSNSKPLIYSSSAAIYGTDGHPNTLYSWSKYVGEKYVLSNGGVALRYFNVYGCEEEHKGRMASIAFQSFQKHKWGEDVFLFPGQPKRDFIYIDDVVSANIFAWDNYKNCAGKYYDVGTGESRTFEDVLDIMQIPYKYLGDSDIPANYQFSTKANPEMFLPGWEAKVNLEEGIRRYKALLKITTFYPL